MQPLSLTFGAIDNHCRREPLFFTDYVNVSIGEEHFRPWAFHLDAFLIHPTNDEEGLSIPLDEDAGIWMFPMILGPADHVKRIARRVGAVRAGPEAFFEYAIGCDKRSTAPSVFFRVGQKFLELKASDYIVKAIDYESKPSCFLAFASRIADLTLGDKWLVGTPLFNSKCLIVDFGRSKIGFAAAKTA
ncbi:ASP-4 protein [Aphelenchoides avenae]|nr:ASP-4 protein [Aphelenchus avenae]